MKDNYLFINLRKSIYFVLMGCFIVTSAIVFLNGTFYWDSGLEIYNEMNLWKRGGFFLIAAVSVFLLFAVFKELYGKLSGEINERLAIGVVWGALIIFQITFLLCSRNLLRYDALNVYDEAVSIFYDGKISATTKNNYFSYYSNNYPITVITWAFLKIGRIFHLVGGDFHNGMLFLQFINLIAIDISILFGLFIVNDFYNNRSVCFCYMLFALFCPLSYVWIPFYYTNTLSMPFYMGGLWLFCKYFFEKPVKKAGRFLKIENSNILLFSAGVLFGVGFLIRATVIITVIAAIITFFVFGKKNGKRMLGNFFALFLGTVIGLCMIKSLVNKYVAFDYSDTAFPAVHWIMMGASGEGTYNKHDEEFTACFQSTQEKYNADTGMLIQRLENMGIDGSIRHFFHKLFLTFGDGTGSYATELSISENYGKLYRYVYGDCNQGMIVYTQIMYLAALFAAVVSAVCVLCKKKFHPIFIVLLNILGAFLFYMIWEAGTIYSIGFIPLFYVALAGGIDFDMQSLSQKKKDRCLKAAIFLLLSILITEGIFWFRKPKGHDELVYQVNQFMFQTDNYQACSDGIVLEQTFKSDGLFNCVAIQARNPLGKLNDSTYSIELVEENGEKRVSFIINSSDVGDYAFVRLPMEQPMKKGDYKLTLKKISGTNDLIWLYYDTGNYDAYTKGELTGFPINSTMDLTFKVYYGEEQSNYFEWYQRFVK